MKKLSLYVFLVLMFCSNVFAETPGAWKIDNTYLTPKCFAHEWISSDNFKEFYNKYAPGKYESSIYASPQWEDWWSNIGIHFGKEIPLEDSFEAWGKTLSLTRYLENCGSDEPKIKDKIELLSYAISREIPLEYCKTLAPNVDAECLDLKLIKLTQDFSGSMRPVDDMNVYGVFKLVNKKQIIIPLSISPTLKYNDWNLY